MNKSKILLLNALVLASLTAMENDGSEQSPKSPKIESQYNVDGDIDKAKHNQKKCRPSKQKVISKFTNSYEESDEEKSKDHKPSQR